MKKLKFITENKLSPTTIIVLSFFYVILLGTFLLMLPISSKSGESVSFLDSLFTATSATCVTGLVIFDTFTQWTIFGQIVILCLIQIGGLGLVTLTTFFTIVVGKKLGFKSLQLAQESVNFNNFINITKVIKSIILYSLVIELIGAFILSFVFVPELGAEGIFTSIFLSISAFCNAGFDILGFHGPFSSLSNYQDNPIVLFTIAGLIFIGGLGFLVWTDVSNYRKQKRLLLHTKIVLMVTGVLIIGGTLLIFVLERDNTLKDLSLFDQFSNSLFQSISTRTAGFNTIPLDSIRGMTKVIFVLLMFIGASSGSTGGGIKVTTIGVIVMTIVSVIKGREDTIMLKKKVSKSVVYKSFSILFVGTLIIFTTCMVLYYNTSGPNSSINLLFEATSAFSTVGLSTGVTSTLNHIGKLMIIITMFIGRVGTLSIFIAIFHRFKRKNDCPCTKINPDGFVIVG